MNHSADALQQKKGFISRYAESWRATSPRIRWDPKMPLTRANVAALRRHALRPPAAPPEMGPRPRAKAARRGPAGDCPLDGHRPPRPSRVMRPAGGLFAPTGHPGPQRSGLLPSARRPAPPSVHGGARPPRKVSLGGRGGRERSCGLAAATGLRGGRPPRAAPVAASGRPAGGPWGFRAGRAPVLRRRHPPARCVPAAALGPRGGRPPRAAPVAASGRPAGGPGAHWEGFF